jgi:hypothetical protein
MIGECGKTLFGPRSQFIKLNGGDFVAVEGASIKERLILSDLRIPYKQVLKGRIILKPGQKDYLLNHLGLGDNATFLSIKATYNQKSVIDDNNYIQYFFHNDSFRVFSFAQTITLTGNVVERIPQLYLTNPNKNYSVQLDIMVAIVDDEYSYFDNEITSSYSLTNINFLDIETKVVNKSIIILNHDYIINLSEILSIERIDRILIITTNKGKLFLEFISKNDAMQGHSIINWVSSGQDRIIQDLENRLDLTIPTIYFTNIVYLEDTEFESPFNTTQGNDFYSEIELDNYYYSNITKEILISILIERVEDNRDGIIEITPNEIKLYNENNIELFEINELGIYKLYFNFSDIAGNIINSDENITITVI